MVQLHPNLQLCLKHLAGSGAVFSEETTVAIDHSLPIKRSEAGLQTLVCWGRLQTTNGKDYIIAEGYNNATAKGKAVSLEAKYFFTQDGSRWADLPPVDQDTRTLAGKLRLQLTGDPAFQYTVEDPEAAARAAAAAGADAAAADDEGGPVQAVVTEIQRLRSVIDSINAATAVVPKGFFIADGHNQVVPNRLFPGLAYPDKLESFSHRSAALDDSKAGGLAADVRGSWAVQHDSFRGLSVLRSLLWPGYAFYYSSADLTWGGLYVGDGLHNDDLVFML